MTFPLPGANWTSLHSLRLVATTGIAGFALQNATPPIISWTAPNDGNMHRALLIAQENVTSALTGGQIAITGTDPDGTAFTFSAFPAGQGTGVHVSSTAPVFLMKPGTTLTLEQFSAATAGAGLVFAEIWGY